jgi:hypothetical protein
VSSATARDDFQLWVTLPDGTHAAVTPLAPRGSGDGMVRLIYARHGTPQGDAVATAQHQHKAVILPPEHALAQQAYVRQNGRRNPFSGTGRETIYLIGNVRCHDIGPSSAR